MVIVMQALSHSNHSNKSVIVGNNFRMVLITSIMTPAIDQVVENKKIKNGVGGGNYQPLPPSENQKN